MLIIILKIAAIALAVYFLIKYVILPFFKAAKSESQEEIEDPNDIWKEWRKKQL